MRDERRVTSELSLSVVSFLLSVFDRNESRGTEKSEFSLLSLFSLLSFPSLLYSSLTLLSSAFLFSFITSSFMSSLPFEPLFAFIFAFFLSF